MTDNDKKELMDLLHEAGVEQEKAAEAYKNQADKFWNDLSYEDQLKAFYSVCSRIRKGDMVDEGTYRYVLYQVFGFAPDAYVIGMEAGYMDIHNSIYTGMKAEKLGMLPIDE